jgi:hypothetical protein
LQIDFLDHVDGDAAHSSAVTADDREESLVVKHPRIARVHPTVALRELTADGDLADGAGRTERVNVCVRLPCGAPSVYRPLRRAS